MKLPVLLSRLDDRRNTDLAGNYAAAEGVAHVGAALCAEAPQHPNSIADQANLRKRQPAQPTNLLRDIAVRV
eukprot:NODE_23636_length_657_cov_6.277358.p4 GENE.NODE_23636_length_657_cov_6.277358~~NODE_23636_length_657_cov_6.277358.p4  ORF type:complete len:72 (-),score=8.51 NODE_23636_length_657_cov_6.277358:255-470(-)